MTSQERSRLVQRVERTSPPSGSVTLNLANPATEGLEKLWVPSHGRSYGRQASVMTRVGSLESYAGAVTGFSTTSYLRDTFDRLAALGDSPFTLLITARRRGPLTPYTVYVHKSDAGSGGSGNGRDFVVTDAGAGLADISFSWRGARHLVYDYLIPGGSTFLAEVGKSSTYVISGAGGGVNTIISAYCNGKDCSPGIIAGGGSADWDSQQVFPVFFGAGWDEGAVRVSDSDLVIDMVGIWPLRQLSANVVRSLSVNPWQLFAPAQRTIPLPQYRPPVRRLSRAVAMAIQPRTEARLNPAFGAIAAVLPVGGAVRNITGGPAQPFALASGTEIGVGEGPVGLGVGSTTQHNKSYKLHSVGNQTNTVWERPSKQVSCLVYLVRYGNAEGNAPIFANQTPNASPYVAWGLADNAGTGQPRFDVAPGGVYTDITGPTAMPNNKPQVLIGVYDGAAAKLFQNGVLQNSVACSGALSYPNDGIWPRGPAVGNFWDYAVTNRSFVGRVFVAALWDRALTAGEIAALSANPWLVFQGQQRTYWPEVIAPTVPVKPVQSRTVRTSQPVASPKINWTNPLTRGLVFLLDSRSGIDLLGSVAESDSTVQGFGPGGVYKGGPDQWASHQNLVTAKITDKLTIFADYEYRTGAGMNNFIFGICQPGGSNYAAGLYSSEAGSNWLFCFVQNASGSQAVGAITSPADTRYQHTLTYDGAEQRQYINGKFEAYNFFSGNLRSDAELRVTWCRWNGVNNNNIKPYVRAIWNRALSASEVKSLSANPWQLFAPQPRAGWMTEPVPFAVPMLSGPSATDITNTTAQPRVDVRY